MAIMTQSVMDMALISSKPPPKSIKKFIQHCKTRQYIIHCDQVGFINHI